MNKPRLALLAFILAGGTWLSWQLFTGKATTPMESTLSPAYQLAGRVTGSLSRALTKVIPVSSLDEKEFGEAIAMRYEARTDTKVRRYRYVNNLAKTITPYRKKPFDYRIFVVDAWDPNAFALPGGVIVVTDGLLKNLRNEAELLAVLSHEMGHVELSHCLDTVRFQLLSKKVGSATLGELADLAVNILLRHSYSRSQEDEADAYAFAMILNTVYNPSALGGVFSSFLAYQNKPGGVTTREKAHPLREYFMSHPHLVHREEKYSEKARRWWREHGDERKYNGKRNLERLSELSPDSSFAGEWSTGQ